MPRDSGDSEREGVYNVMYCTIDSIAPGTRALLAAAGYPIHAGAQNNRRAQPRVTLGETSLAPRSAAVQQFAPNWSESSEQESSIGT